MPNTQDQAEIIRPEQDFDPFDMDSSEQPLANETMEDDYQEPTDEPVEDLSALERGQEEEKAPDEKLSSVEAYRKLQSEKDRIASEHKKLQQEMEELKLYQPIAQYFDKNPKAIDMFQQLLSNPEGLATAKETSTQDTVPEGLTEPQFPEMPDVAKMDYEEAQKAQLDYMTKVAKYQKDFVDYQKKSQDYARQKEEETKKQQQQVQQQQQFVSNIVSEAVQNGLPQSEIKDFYEEVFSKQATGKELYLLYKYRKNGNNTPSRDQLSQKAQEMKLRQQRQTGVPPVGTVPGQSDAPVDVAKSFGESLGGVDKNWIFD